MKRIVKGADEKSVDQVDILNDLISGLSDDFDYVLDGLETMGRNGNAIQATELATQFKSSISEMISNIASQVSNQEVE